MTPSPNRRSIRLADYDYATPGGYFVTIGAHDRQPLFADPIAAQIISGAWADIPNHHAHIGIDEFVVMPNHVHGIVFLGASAPERARAQRVAPLQRGTSASARLRTQPIVDVPYEPPEPERARAQRVAPLQRGTSASARLRTQPIVDVPYEPPEPEPARAQRVAPLQQSGTLGVIVRAFKARVTRDLRTEMGADLIVWQRNYYEHVIRDERALQRIRQYIIDNPVRWEFDHENPAGRPDRTEREFANWLRDSPPHFAKLVTS